MATNIKNILTRLFKHTPLTSKGGIELQFFCDVCKHHKKKLSININTGEWRCWVCNSGGLSFRSLLKRYKAPVEYYHLLNVGSHKQKKKTKPIKYDSISLPSEFLSLSVNNIDPKYKHAIIYCKKRNILLEDIYRYNIGYCLYGEYTNRLIIPSYDLNNNLNYFIGRTFYGSSPLKYKMPRNISKNIIGFESHIDFNEEITLVEGVFDAISVRYNTIPLFGKTLPTILKEKLVKTKPPRVNVLLDKDAFVDAIDICEFLIKNFIKCNLVIPENRDPNEMTFENIWKNINKNNIITDTDIFKIKIKKSLYK